MGRSHRSNQVQPPEYKLLVSPLGGERRFVAAVVKRLESLGALTRGDRRATGVTKSWSCFNVDTPQGVETVYDVFHHSNWLAWELLGHGEPNPNSPLVKSPMLPAVERHAIAKLCVENAGLVGAHDSWIGASGNVDGVANCVTLLHGARLWLSLVGIDVEDYERGSTDSGIVAKFLNRILGLEISRQQWLFDYFARYLEKAIKAAIRDGSYQQGIRDISGRKLTFLEGEKKNLRLSTPSPYPIVLHVASVDTGMDFDAACAKLRQAQAGMTAMIATNEGGWQSQGLVQKAARFGERDGFYVNREEKQVCLCIETGDTSLRGLSVKTDQFSVFMPDSIRKYHPFAKIRLMGFRDKLKPGQAKGLWTRNFEHRRKGFKNYLLAGPVRPGVLLSSSAHPIDFRSFTSGGAFFTRSAPNVLPQ